MSQRSRKVLLLEKFYFWKGRKLSPPLAIECQAEKQNHANESFPGYASLFLQKFLKKGGGAFAGHLF